MAIALVARLVLERDEKFLVPGVKTRPCEEGTIQSTRVVQDYAP
jgi:hypothetical protein